MEAEFVACFEATIQANWLWNFISGLGIIDSIAKHTELKYFAVKEEVQKQRVSIEHINTKLMIADPLTKGLLSKSFIEPIENMNIIVIKDCRVYCLLLFWIVDILSSFMICLWLHVFYICMHVCIRVT